MNLKNKKYLSLIVWIFLLLFIGLIIGGITQGSVDTWYLTLNRSPLTPPNQLFPIAWSILYVMIATSGWMIWRLKPSKGLRFIKKLYIIQLVLNWSWTPLFFHYHLTGLALICLLAIIISVVFLVMGLYRKNNIATMLLAPYLLWLLFAFHLNFYIWQNN